MINFFTFTGSTSLSLRLRGSGMSTGSLMIWWPKLSRVREVSCGPARTTMETSNQILLLKVCVVGDDKYVVAISLIQ